jgi:hypothetical protein
MIFFFFWLDVFDNHQRLLVPTAVALEEISKVNIVYENYKKVVKNDKEDNIFLDQDINLLNNPYSRISYLNMYYESS